jgi:hypothetical protein
MPVMIHGFEDDQKEKGVKDFASSCMMFRPFSNVWNPQSLHDRYIA